MAFNPLALLLGQEAATALGMGQPEDEFTDPVTGQNTMVVSGANRRPPVATPPIFNDAPVRTPVDPRYVLNDDRIAPTKDEMKEILPRKGMFGVKGTLRDVLGILGDAFLVQGDADPIYSKQRQREQQGDAMFGYGDNPMQAIERLAAAGFPEEAQKAWQAYQDNEYKQGQLRSQEAARTSQIDDRRYENVLKARNQVARWANKADTPGKVAIVLREAKRIAAELGVPLSDLGIDDENMTEDERAILAAGDMTVNQQVQVPFTERKVKVQERNAASGETRASASMISATRPRAGPQPRSETSLELWKDIDRRIESGGKVTAGERAFHKKWSTGGGKGSRLDGIAPPPAPGGSARRFRKLN